MIERWSRDQVLALAPDASSQKASQGVASPGKWQARGVTGEVLWGECKGSGAKPYLAGVDLSEPAYRCSCPSRKFPCKHALGLLLLWSADGVPEAQALPGWVAEWLAGRAERAAKAETRAEGARAKAAADLGAGGVGGADDAGAGGRGATESVRQARVAAGLSELERWLADQVRQGLAGADRRDWDDLARRLVDAQAPGVAATVSRLAGVRGAEEWPGRLLGEYSLLNLLVVAYRRRDELAPDLARTVTTRVGFPVTREEVLAGPVLRDRWDVLGRRDEEQDRLTARRVWLRGRETGRPALVLSFAPVGQALDASLVTGTTLDADLAFYPGAAPLRALVATRHTPARPVSGAAFPDPAFPGPAFPGPALSAPVVPGAGEQVPPGVSVTAALAEVAAALEGDPWTDSWPLVLADVVPGAERLGELPLHPKADTPWRLIAVSGGRPLTVAAEWTPLGVIPLTTWGEDGRAVIL